MSRHGQSRATTCRKTKGESQLAFSYCGPNAIDPSRLTPDYRIREISVIMSRAILRKRQSESRS